ncbi:DUF2690 domain-containing protein [Streptomyces sp. URMC 123]|uniref:DUF2690 domain-containing protein n=1 Tax=Streptomyces sp. URMC 123 TaxID=3423403 RepID=UPI003F1C592A
MNAPHNPDRGTPDPSLRHRVGQWLQEHSKHTLVVAVAAALVGGVTPILATGALQDWVGPRPPAPCPGAGCDGRNPLKEGCAADALTWLPGDDNPAVLQLRYSKHCGAVWGRITRGGAGDLVTVRVHGGSARSAVVEYGREQFTPMATVRRAFRVVACAEPATTPSPARTWAKYCIRATHASDWR